MVINSQQFCKWRQQSSYFNCGWNNPFWLKNYHYNVPLISLEFSSIIFWSVTWAKNIPHNNGLKLIPIQFSQLGLKVKSSVTSKGKNRNDIFMHWTAVNISELLHLYQKIIATKLVEQNVFYKTNVLPFSFLMFLFLHLHC